MVIFAVMTEACEKTHCKPFDMPKPEQWVFGYTHVCESYSILRVYTSWSGLIF